MSVAAEPHELSATAPERSTARVGRPPWRTWLVAAAALAVLLTACPEAALARVTVGQTMRAAGSVRKTLAVVAKSGHLTVDQRYGYRRLAAPGDEGRADARPAQQGAPARRARIPDRHAGHARLARGSRLLRACGRCFASSTPTGSGSRRPHRPSRSPGSAFRVTLWSTRTTPGTASSSSRSSTGPRSTATGSPRTTPACRR